MRAKLKAIKETLMKRRHDPVPEQGRWLHTVVGGYLRYFAVPGTSRQLGIFRGQVNRFWLHALRRRSQKGQNLTWGRMKRLIKTWIPSVRVLHPYPNQRLCVNHPR
jgi:RNA-directed DNA polymerase